MIKKLLKSLFIKEKRMVKELLKSLFIDDVLKKDIIFLKKVALFQGLSDRSLAKIALIVFKKTYLPGEKIYENRHEAKVVYIVKKGQIRLMGQNSSEIVESEDFFGEISLIENRHHTYDAVALKESQLYLVYRAKFEDIIESDNKIGLVIMRNLASLFAPRL
jgi:CRP/FNR family transcriptional regulator